MFQTEAGEGHRSAERVIRKALGETVRIESFEIYKDVLGKYDPASRYLGLSSPEIYNKVVLQKGHTGLIWAVLAGLNLAYLKIMKRRLARRVAEFLGGRGFDLAVSLAPLVNFFLAEGVRLADPNMPLITVATDFTEPVKGIWFQDPRQTVIVCTPEARDQAVKTGIPKSRVHLLSGAPIDTDKFKPSAVDTRQIKARLSGDRPVVLFLSGGHAGQVIEDYVRAVDESSINADILCVCGRNENLRQSLAAQGLGKLKLVTGFVEVAPYYAAADIVVGKPGPGVITEAAHMRVPLLLEFNRLTMAQERFNAGWAVKRGIAETFADGRELVEKLGGMLSPEVLEQYRRQTSAIENNSLAEIKAVFEKYLYG